MHGQASFPQRERSGSAKTFGKRINPAGRAQGRRRVIVQRIGGAEQGKHRIANKIDDNPAFLADAGTEPIEIIIEHGHHLLGFGLFR